MSSSLHDYSCFYEKVWVVDDITTVVSMQMLSRINETSDFDRLNVTIKYEWKREFCIEKKNEKRFEFKV